MISTLSSRHTKFDVPSTSVWGYDVKEGKGLMDNSIWWSRIIHAFSNKIERKASSETLRKRTIVLHGNKLDKRIHIGVSSNYAINEKITTILGG